MGISNSIFKACCGCPSGNLDTKDGEITSNIAPSDSRPKIPEK